MSIFRRRRPDPLEAPSPDERRRAAQARAHLEATVADVEGEAYDVPQPQPSWPDAAPEQDRVCFACRVRCCAGRCWKCGRPTHLRSLPASSRSRAAVPGAGAPTPGSRGGVYVPASVDRADRAAPAPNPNGGVR